MDSPPDAALSIEQRVELLARTAVRSVAVLLTEASRLELDLSVARQQLPSAADAEGWPRARLVASLEALDDDAGVWSQVAGVVGARANVLDALSDLGETLRILEGRKREAATGVLDPHDEDLLPAAWNFMAWTHLISAACPSDVAARLVADSGGAIDSETFVRVTDRLHAASLLDAPLPR